MYNLIAFMIKAILQAVSGNIVLYLALLLASSLIFFVNGSEFLFEFTNRMWQDEWYGWAAGSLVGFTLWGK